MIKITGIVSVAKNYVKSLSKNSVKRANNISKKKEIVTVIAKKQGKFCHFIDRSVCDTPVYGIGVPLPPGGVENMVSHTQQTHIWLTPDGQRTGNVIVRDFKTHAYLNLSSFKAVDGNTTIFAMSGHSGTSEVKYYSMTGKKSLREITPEKYNLECKKLIISSAVNGYAIESPYVDEVVKASRKGKLNLW